MAEVVPSPSGEGQKTPFKGCCAGGGDCWVTKSLCCCFVAVARGLSCLDQYLLPCFAMYIEAFRAACVTLLFCGSGGHVSNGAEVKKDIKPMVLYNRENEVQSRLTRGLLTMMNIDYIAKPCLELNDPAQMGSVNSQELLKYGKTVPVLVDPNSNDQAFSGFLDIEGYLTSVYGPSFDTSDKSSQLYLWMTRFYIRAGKVLNVLMFFLRPMPMMGNREFPSLKPKVMLKLYSYEASLFCKLVREKLDSLGISYHVVTIGRGAVEREEFSKTHAAALSNFRKKFNLIKVPLLIDANMPTEKTAIFDSRDIICHLEDHYAVTAKEKKE